MTRHVATATIALALCLALGACRSAAPGAAPATGAQPAVAAAPADRPPEARPGEAWCRVWIPPVTKEVAETVCVRPACVKKVPVPPTYGTRTKLVCLAPAQIREVQTPAVWTTRVRDVLACPEREVVERVACEPGALAAGEVQCDCFVKRVIPPVYEQVEEAVCVEPSRCCIEYQPAQYQCVEERFILKPAHCQEVLVPAQFETRMRTVICTPGRWEWRRNTDCEVPEGLTALEVTMVDVAADGREEGIFRVGQEVRYELTVENDVGGKALDGLKVVFQLPPELVFVSGSGDGLTVVGGGRQAETSRFALAVDQVVSLRLVARVVRGPAQGNLIQTIASVVAPDGSELVHETESTTIEGGR